MNEPGPNRQKANDLSVRMAIDSPQAGPLGPLIWTLKAVERLLDRIEYLEEQIDQLTNKVNSL